MLATVNLGDRGQVVADRKGKHICLRHITPEIGRHERGALADPYDLQAPVTPLQGGAAYPEILRRELRGRKAS